jgi:ribosome recycling factor
MPFDFASFSIKAQKVLDHVRQDIASLRTGRASASMLDSVTVEVYGSQMKVMELAAISVPEPTTIVISPWDKSTLPALEKSIVAANLNLQPIVDKDIIRISIPPLTTERRQQMVKQLAQKIEQGRVMMRGVRTDTKQDIDKQKSTAGVSEDDVKRDLEALEKKAKVFFEQLEQVFKDKEKDLMSI